MKEKTFNLEELQALTPEERKTVFAGKVKIKGKGIVRDKDGNPKYDRPELAGTYGEKET